MLNRENITRSLNRTHIAFALRILLRVYAQPLFAIFYYDDDSDEYFQYCQHSEEVGKPILFSFRACTLCCEHTDGKI